MAEFWERQPAESDTAYNAFQVYLKLTERTFSKVAEQLQKSSTLIRRWAKKYSWRERADAYDNEINRKAMAEASEEYAAMIVRQLQIGRLLQGKAANAIRLMELNNLPPKYLPALIEMIKAGVKIERSARDLKHDEPQENLFVKTLEKISRRIEDDE